MKTYCPVRPANRSRSCCTWSGVKSGSRRRRRTRARPTAARTEAASRTSAWQHLGRVRHGPVGGARPAVEEGDLASLPHRLPRRRPMLMTPVPPMNRTLGWLMSATLARVGRAARCRGRAPVAPGERAQASRSRSARQRRSNSPSSVRASSRSRRRCSRSARRSSIWPSTYSSWLRLPARHVVEVDDRADLLEREAEPLAAQDQGEPGAVAPVVDPAWCRAARGRSGRGPRSAAPSGG